ncbi:ABC transporter ATP-binding protein [Actinopolymorpha alba]|uniref:ABC transporter ATP-binding protein n=1 Tax=Actinopolymorpha alba TaxID=533267 RepID=UPI0003785E55|nr:ABC transporter ATP-binding protein [Actinopolymorpha alba]
MSEVLKPALQALGVTAGYRRRRHPAVAVLQDLQLEAHPGELITLIGPNGAGKSTLLRTLVGAQPPLAGKVLLDGVDLTTLSPRRRAQRLAVVLTEPVDVGLMTVEAVVALGRIPFRPWAGRESKRDRDAVDQALADAGVEDLRHRMLSDLSDGERQRVMVARALAQEPAVLVLDEPTAFLDVARRIELAAMLTKLTTTTGAAIILSTHDLGFALRRADQVWLVGGDGTVTASAPEDLAYDGAIARTFAGDNMSFDDASATVVVADVTSDATVHVVADGRLKLWTEHAVRRAGWALTGNASGHVLQVEPDSPCRWRLNGTHLPAATHAEGVGFDSLVAHLRGRGAARNGKAPSPTSRRAPQ